jgi:plasmid stabilization system protein ParE
MMELKWTSKALSDLARLYEFLAPKNKAAAARAVQALTAAPSGLRVNPRIGEKLEEFDPREVRRILVGHYEIRYEIQESTIYVLRLWHTREDR